jgi:ribosomal protein S19E (S16A)
MDRTDIVESMRKRHAYGATDNIILDFQAVDAQGHTYLMGDAFAAPTAPHLKVKVFGTDTLQRVEIIKDGRFVFTTSPQGKSAEFTYVDNEPPQGESWYYVRVTQMDRNLAWSSPIWVKYGK